MTTQDFCEKYSVERHGTKSLKWDALDEEFGDPDLISMWVADMDFKGPEQVREALIKRVEHGAFGYSVVPDDYFEAAIKWQLEYHGNLLKKEWFRISTGTVTSLYWIINAFTQPGDSIMIITPVYYPFHNAVNNTGRKLIMHKLLNSEGYYTFDFAQFERDITENKVKLLIESSPHNPVGRVWTKQELEQLLAICKKHNVLVIADELHQDLIIGEKKQIPAFLAGDGAYNDIIITVVAASKSFNLAGLIHSHILIADAALREKYDAYICTVNSTEANIFGCIATQAAYTYGGEWLKSLIEVVRENYKFFCDEFARELPKAVISPLEGTYLLWVDLRAYTGTENVKEFIQDKCRIAIDFGEWFCPDAKGFVRFNLATNPGYVRQAVGNIIANKKTTFY
jgi:cystathionine beta-lyase